MLIYCDGVHRRKVKILPTNSRLVWIHCKLLLDLHIADCYFSLMAVIFKSLN